MRDLQEGGSHCRIRAGGRRLRPIRARDGLDRGSARVEKIPDGVGFERATFVEPVNTCLKGLEKCAVGADETVLVMGQGPIGLLFTALLRRQGVENVIATDRLPRAAAEKRAVRRVRSAGGFGGRCACGQGRYGRARGADVVIVAALGAGHRGARPSACRAEAEGSCCLRRLRRRSGSRWTAKAICAEDRAVVRLLQRFGRCAGRIGRGLSGTGTVSRGGVDFSPSDLGRIRKRGWNWARNR